MSPSPRIFIMEPPADVQAVVLGSQNFDQLRDALKDALKSRGVVDSIKSTLRAEVYNVLEDHEAQSACPKPAPETMLLNNLIEEYLLYNGYLNTLSVFRPESGQPDASAARLGRAVMAHELGVPDTEASSRVPLLYSAVAKLQRTAGDAPFSKAPARTVSRQNPADRYPSPNEKLAKQNPASSRDQASGSSMSARPSSPATFSRGSRAASPAATSMMPSAANQVQEDLYEFSDDDALEESYVSRSGREIMFAV